MVLAQHNKDYVLPNKIPSLLKKSDRWVVWKKGPLQKDGKFAKIPISIKTGKPANANDPNNWNSFEDAYTAYQSKKGNGVGIALTSKPIVDNLYLVAIDIDRCERDFKESKAIRKDLGIYAEISPSLNGVRMFGLSDKQIKGGNDGNNHEMYSSNRFMTVTGLGGKGEVIDATDQLLSLEKRWFPKKKVSMREIDQVTQNLLNSTRPETAENIDHVKEQLSHISADCTYEMWRDIVWSVLSTRWDSAESMVRDWSMTAPDRYEENAFDSIAASFDPSRGISLGTLHHHACEAGWQPLTTVNKVNTLNSSKRFHLLTVAELRGRPRPEWRIRDVLPSSGLSALFGPSGSGKTFLALDMACTIATSQPHWFGHKVMHSPVVYVALEGEGGISDRISAWEKERSSALDTAPIHFLLGSFHLLKTDQVNVLIQEINSTVSTTPVIFIDTLNQSAPGMDENGSADMSAAIGNAKRISNETNGGVVLVHHSGKDVSRGMRGHSSLPAAMDSIIEVKSQKAGRSWSLSKSKEGESGVQHDFDLSPHAVGKHDDGGTVTSCAVKPAMRVPVPKKAGPKGKNQNVVYNTLKKVESEYPDGVPFAKAIELSIEHIEGNTKPAAAKTAINAMVENGTLLLTDNGGVSCS